MQKHVNLPKKLAPANVPVILDTLKTQILEHGKKVVLYKLLKTWIYAYINKQKIFTRKSLQKSTLKITTITNFNISNVNIHVLSFYIVIKFYDKRYV